MRNSKMKNQNTTRSVLFGFALGVGAVVVLGAVRTQPPVVGRFQLGVGANNALIIDTLDGQVWRSQDAEFAEPKIKETRN